MTTRQIKAFQSKVYAGAQTAARHYPWRSPAVKIRRDGTIDPYVIVVSELMLQQTQTARVIEYFPRFISAFPTIRALASAPLADVVRLWQGLGYNRRAKMLHACAREVVEMHAGHIPKERTTLVTLPGIGPYTAGAIRAFAYNEPEVFIETNIRTVYYYYFFQDHEKVHDSELLSLVEKTLDRNNPRAWYAALMDHGATLKQRGVRLNEKHPGYTKQSKFEGSDRQVRGAILRALTDVPASEKSLLKKLSFPETKLHEQLVALSREGFIVKPKTKWELAQ